MITWGMVYWPVGLCVVSLLFILAELYALFTNGANTLSWFCWHELNVSTALHFQPVAHHAAWWLSLVAWVIFTVVITLHIWFMSV